jgi:hypothetical protein
MLLPGVALLFSACQPQSLPYQSLFGAAPTPLTAEEMSQIYAFLAERFPPADEATFSDPNCGDIAAEVELTDLNGDGHPETFVTWGNACTSGMAGRSISMFSSRADGTIAEHFGFPASGFSQLPGRSEGYSDLQFEGPGFCFAVWAWQGEAYEFKCNMPQDEGGCAQRENVCPRQL